MPTRLQILRALATAGALLPSPPPACFECGRPTTKLVCWACFIKTPEGKAHRARLARESWWARQQARKAKTTPPPPAND